MDVNVKVKECTMVCPADETPRHNLWLSTIDLVGRTPYAHNQSMYIYRPKEDQNLSKHFDAEILKESLSRVLVPFYPVAGRLKKNEKNGRIEIDCNAAGALFVDVETWESLDEFGDFKSSNEFRKLVLHPWDYSGGLSSFPLLLARVTRFKCGGVCIVFSIHHQTTDGIAFAYLINSWSRFARGLDLDVHPFHDRVIYLGPRHPPQIKFRHLEYEPPLPPISPKGFAGETSTTKECQFKLSKPQINALNLEANSPSEEKEKHHSYKLSTYEVLAAHVWRTSCKARELANDQLVKLYIPTDGRSRLKDPTALPEGYVGNVIFYTACIAKARDMTCKPLWYAAGKVHEALKKVENVDYLRSAVDYLESQPDITPLVRGAHTVTCPNLTINSFGRLPFYEADFGWGKPEFAGHSKLRYEGQAIIVPSPIRDGSYSVNINLFAVHMPLFQKYFYHVGNLPNKL